MVMSVIIIVVMIIELVVFVLGDGALWINTCASLLGSLSLLLLVGLDIGGILVAGMIGSMGLLLELLNLRWVETIGVDTLGLKMVHYIRM